MLRPAHRKGLVAFEAVAWIVRSLIMVFMLLSIMFVVSAFIVKNIDTRSIESYTLANAIYYSNAIIYQDQITGRAYPGVVDPVKDGPIDESFYYGEKTDFIAARSTHGQDSAYYKKDSFNDWNVLYIAGLTEGIGGVRKQTLSKRDVIIEVVTKNA